MKTRPVTRRTCHIGGCGLLADRLADIQWKRGEQWGTVKTFGYCDTHIQTTCEQIAKRSDAKVTVREVTWKE